MDVEVPSSWYACKLRPYRRVCKQWSGWVRFSSGLAETRIECFDAYRMRRVD